MSLINTRIQNLRAQSNIDKYELRPSRYGALDVFLRQSEDPAGILTPELVAMAETSIGNVLETPVFDFDGDVTIGSTRSAVIADDENTSQMVTITFATYAWGFTMVPALFMNNEISMQRDFNAKFLKYLYKFANVLDEAAVTKLTADATEILNDPLVYAFATEMLTADYEQRTQLIGDLNPMMASNDFYGQIHIVGNTGIESHVRQLAQLGLYNAENRQLQYADKIFHFTNRLQNALGSFGTGFAVNEGSLGLLGRFEREVLLNTVARTGHEWSRERLPLIDMEVGTYYYESVGDYSGIAGAASADLTRARKEHYGFAVDVAFLTSYNSDAAARPSPILRFEVEEPGD